MMILNVDTVGSLVNQVIVRGFGFFYGVFAITNLAEGQFTFLIGCLGLNSFSICVVKRELCTLDRLIGLAVLLDKLYAAFNRIFTEHFGVFVGDCDGLVVFADVEVVSFCIGYIAFRSFSFLYSIRAIRDFLQLIDTL